jgi:hypothetical protein
MPPVPVAYAGARAIHDFQSLGTDNLLMRSRLMLQSEAPPGVTLVPQLGEQMYELVSVTTGLTVASFGTEIGRHSYGDGQSCQFPNGDRMHVHTTSGATVGDVRLNATLYKIGSGWQPTVRIANLVTGGEFRPICVRNGVARVMGSSTFIDWIEASGWQTAQNLFNQLRGSETMLAARGDDGSALIAWREYRLDPNGPITLTTTTYPSNVTTVQQYAITPRLSDIASSTSQWMPQLGLPLYEPVVTNDTVVENIAYNPATKRYVVTIVSGGSSGVAGASKSYFADYSRTDGWSSPWTAPLIQGVQAFSQQTVLFNASGKGVALGYLNGQTYISEWR